MALSEFTALLGVFLSGSVANLASLTLTQVPEDDALPSFIDEARRAAAKAGLRLLEIVLPAHCHDLPADIVGDISVTKSDGSNVVRFVYGQVDG